MKKTVLVILSLLFFTFCSEKIIEPENPSSLSKRRVKPPAGEPGLPVLNISVDGNPLILNSEQVTGDEPVIYLNENHLPKFSYSISSPNEPLDYFKIELWYDSNVDGIINRNREFGATLIETTFINGEESVTHDFDWTGKVSPSYYNDPTYGEDYGGGDFIISDQLATKYPLADEPTADRYYMRVFLYTQNTGLIVKSYFWLVNSIQPAFSFHLDAMQLESISTEKNSCNTVTRFRIVDDNGNPVQNAKVFLYYNDDEYGTYGRANITPTDSDGWASIVQVFGRRNFGDYKISFGSAQYFNGVNQVMAVYDPTKNTGSLKVFPDDPSITINIPNSTPFQIP